MKKFYYMHTLDKKPAFFSDGRVCFMNGPYSRRGNTLVDSLLQIRREQRAAIRADHKDGLPWDRWEYGYVRVEMPLRKL